MTEIINKGPVDTYTAKGISKQIFKRFITLPIGTINVFEMVNPDILYVILGYELFVNKDKIKNNKKTDRKNKKY